MDNKLVSLVKKFNVAGIKEYFKDNVIDDYSELVYNDSINSKDSSKALKNISNRLIYILVENSIYPIFDSYKILFYYCIEYMEYGYSVSVEYYKGLFDANEVGYDEFVDYLNVDTINQMVSTSLFTFFDKVKDIFNIDVSKNSDFFDIINQSVANYLKYKYYGVLVESEDNPYVLRVIYAIKNEDYNKLNSSYKDINILYEEDIVEVLNSINLKDFISLFDVWEFSNTSSILDYSKDNVKFLVKHYKKDNRYIIMFRNFFLLNNYEGELIPKKMGKLTMLKNFIIER